MQTLYLKYRPKNFEELAWQGHVKKLFKNALLKSQVAHSYLFSGPRGTGKTSTARILAKALNCENPVNGYEPCNKCDACVSIDTGRSMDVVEMDAASNRGIDEIRAIRDRVAYLPSELKYKIYIIDEVHMLTKEAFNALLKTLEEPPQHTVFILATTEMQKVPETVISRCQVVEFRRIPVKEIENRLISICEQEGFDFDLRAIAHIAKRATGGMRDAIGLLEEVARFSSSKISVDDVTFVLGEVSSQMVEEYVQALLNNESDALLSVLDSLEEKGIEAANFLNQVLDYVNEHILEDGSVEIGAFAAELLTRIKYDERPFEILRIFSVLKTSKKSTFEKTLPVSKKEKNIKNDAEKLVEWYAREGRMDVFACLATAQLRDFGDRLLVINSSELCHENLKVLRTEIEETFKKLTSRQITLVSAYSAIPIDDIEPKTREAIVRALSLFGGKLIPEGGEEIV